jgi:hypothetical protein
MKDTELRGVVLQQFYDRRREGWLSVGDFTGKGHFTLPGDGADKLDVCRVCDQLGECGLLTWHGGRDYRGVVAGGSGVITARGVDVVERAAAPPIVIHFDQSRHEQNIHVTGGTGVQIAGDNATQQQTVTHHVENLIRAIGTSEEQGTD